MMSAAPCLPSRFPRAFPRHCLALAAVAGLVACSDDGAGTVGVDVGGGSLQSTCDLNPSFLADGGVGRDGIPALTDPPMASPTSPGLAYLEDRDRVVGIVVDGQPYALPHNILVWHEIVNLNVGGHALAVTFCPLTGTTLAFDRASIDGRELGVSGLLFMANLVMYDRGSSESLWPQMLGRARCGPKLGRTLERYPAVEMTWGAWKALHPTTLAVTDDTGHSRTYEVDPYGAYAFPDNPSFLGFPMPPLDPRRPPKERILGIPFEGGGGGLAFPFGELEARPGAHAVVEFLWEGEPAFTLWSDDAQGAMAYRSLTTDGGSVSLTTEHDLIVDRETGTRWSIDGRALEGPMEGASLVPIEAAYTSFWASWAAFFPDTELCGLDGEPSQDSPGLCVGTS